MATAIVLEGHDVSYPVTPTVVSKMRNIEHVLTLVREQDGWKIENVASEDTLRKSLGQSGLSPEEMKRRIDRFAVEVLGPGSPSQGQGTSSASMASSQGVSTVIAYAEQWWDRPYNDGVYRDFTAFGGDCTNFASQAIYASGNVPMTDTGSQYGWWGNTSWAGNPWMRVQEFYDYMTSHGYGYLENGMSYLHPGDIIQYDWTRDGIWDHTVIVVVMQNGYLPLVNGHTPDVWHEPFYSVGSYTNETQRGIVMTAY